ncbi:conserved Plasmodium protein, unknown function [Plasmodium relictum]|uniref:Uncharacterized protein n=1 Tax=Plasmodium relictum TaxID=85471 RepID=A0A1J1HBQ8_PLARL|nr:conserved Plasmodium protein, unknown function [Plasmodium relictum]CRH02937.1 conserved Plasmodium protein, unknown function [Plasmodium relictum]
MNEISINKNENKLINKSNPSENDNFINNIINIPEIICRNGKKNEEKNFDYVNSINEAKKHQLDEKNLAKSNKIHCNNNKEFDRIKFDEMKNMNNYDIKCSKYVNSKNIKFYDKNYNFEDMTKNKIMNSDENSTLIDEQKHIISNNDLIKEQNAKNDFLKKALLLDYEKDLPFKNNQSIINNYKERTKVDNDKIILINENEKENIKNSTESIKICNKIPEKEIGYPNDKVVENSEEHKKDIKNKNDSIKIDIFYSSKSEKSLDESEENSSYDSFEDFYENICQSDVPLDFYKKFLNTKNSNFLESEYYLDSKNDATEEINILNNYIKNITENLQKSAPIDIDNKLINILSLSFLTFIDHVIYDSHIYALKNEFLQEVEMIKTKSKDEFNYKEYQKIEDLYNFIPDDNNKIKNRINNSNEKNSIINEKTFNDKFEKLTTNSSIINDNNIKEKHKENSNIKKSNDNERKKKKNISMIYNPDIINICLTNLYNQKLVDQITDKKKNSSQEVLTVNNNITISKNDNINAKNEDIPIDTKKIENLRNYDNNLGSEKKAEKKIFESENHIKEKTDEIKENINFNKSEDSLQTNLNDKLYQRKVIIKQINDKIKKNNSNMNKFMNYQKYSLEDIFDI